MHPDSSTYWLPDTVTQRYARNAERLGIKTHLHQARHYSATELISAGVDVRTVAGRLGHSGGGTTTLRIYTAFVYEADQRASEALKRRLPIRSRQQTTADRALADPRAPFERIAGAIRRQVANGEYRPRTQLPGTRDLIREYGASASTIRRAVNLLADWCGQCRSANPCKGGLMLVGYDKPRDRRVSLGHARFGSPLGHQDMP